MPVTYGKHNGSLNEASLLKFAIGPGRRLQIDAITVACDGPTWLWLKADGQVILPIRAPSEGTCDLPINDNRFKQVAAKDKTVTIELTFANLGVAKRVEAVVFWDEIPRS